MIVNEGVGDEASVTSFPLLLPSFTTIEFESKSDELQTLAFFFFFEIILPKVERFQEPETEFFFFSK